MIRLNEKRLDQIQTVLVNDDKSVDFTEGEFANGLWYVSNNGVYRYPDDEESEATAIYSDRPDDLPYGEFFKAVKGKDLKARMFLGWIGGKHQYQVYDDWEDFAKVLGISELVTLATKVPKVVARRFEVFANRKGGRSSVLRELVYGYVKQQMVDQADTLMFKENI